MKWHNVEQNTDEWMAMRVGKIGGSSIGKIMANYGKAFGNPAHDLAVKIAIEQITGISQESGFTNEHMDRGHEQEPIARRMYEDEHFCDVSNGGFFENGDIGVSPDGLVDNDGVIEIKSVIQSVHFDTVNRGKFDPSYKWQLYFNLQQSGREWIDFVSFCATFPEGKRLFVDRLYKDKSAIEFEMIDTRLAEFRRIVKEKKTVINRIGCPEYAEEDAA